MKKIIILSIFVFLTNKSFGQLNYYDLYLIKNSKDLRLAGYMLLSHNNFKFEDNNIRYLNSDGWVKSSRGKDYILLKYTLLSDSTGCSNGFIQTSYFINDKKSYSYFINHLSDNKFERIIDKDKNGNTFEIWSGTKDIEERLRIISIRHDQGMYIVEIL